MEMVLNFEMELRFIQSDWLLKKIFLSTLQAVTLSKDCCYISKIIIILIGITFLIQC